MLISENEAKPASPSSLFSLTRNFITKESANEVLFLRI